MEKETSRIDIGFTERCENWKLQSKFFPSKVGGKPAWLNLENIPSNKDLECQVCHDPCIFLCQVYAPYEEDARAFHRTIFLFICRNPDCCRPNENGNLKVFRSQLEKHNKFYPSYPPVETEEWRPDITIGNWTKSCHLCGICASSHCSKCKKVYYCCRKHQVYDWKHGHKLSCGATLESAESSFLLPEFEIVTEVEENSCDNPEDDDADHAELEIKEYEKMVINNEAGTLQNEQNVDADLLKMSAANDDETFFEFTTRIKKYPDQILRYERDGKVLYISSKNQVTDIPNCQECGSERQFEFQIMPQLLNFFEFDDTLNGMDWGILAVFSCKRSCVPKSNYVLEYIWKQDIVDIGNEECS